MMSLFGVNMAVPFKENIRESRIYFLSSVENGENHTIDKKYLFFKTVQLVLSLCSLMLFAYGIRATENELEDMIKYVVLGGLTIYPLLFILLQVDVKRRPLTVVFNAIAMIILLAIGATSVSSLWTNQSYFFPPIDKDRHYESLMLLRSSFLSIASSFLYVIESLIMCYEIRKFNRNN
nr:PREDICTED: uncharacterized protein LOC107398604 [Tribolium castaneum]|eukprot:XP_015838660.1 PREDICTED: uncharacterized protein LOC107398604 [Tribolium castaneum]